MFVTWEKAMSFNRIAMVKVSCDYMRIPSETKVPCHREIQGDLVAGALSEDFQVSQILTAPDRCDLTEGGEHYSRLPVMENMCKRDE